MIADGYFVLRWRDQEGPFLPGGGPGHHRQQALEAEDPRLYGLLPSGQYQASYRARSLRVLTVTTSQKRLANLKATTEQAGGGVMFWFTTLDVVKARERPDRAIWHVAGSRELLLLIDPASPARSSPVSYSLPRNLDTRPKVWYNGCVNRCYINEHATAQEHGSR